MFRIVLRIIHAYHFVNMNQLFKVHIIFDFTKVFESFMSISVVLSLVALHSSRKLVIQNVVVHSLRKVTRQPV